MGDFKVIDMKDYSKGVDGLPKADVLKFFLEDRSWVAIRPSGTEPKLKFYIAVKGIDENEDVWYMERIRQIDDTPAVFEQSYIAISLLPNLTRKDLMSSKFEYVRSQGLEISDSDREISAEIPDDYVASSLHLKRNEPILLAECITYLKGGQVLEYSTIFYNQKKYRFKLYAD